MNYLDFIQVGFAFNFSLGFFPMAAAMVAVFGLYPKWSPDRSYIRSLYFSAGIVLVYTLFGFLASAGGFFLELLFQSVFFWLGIGCLWFFFALALLGVKVFRLPSWSMKGIAKNRQPRYRSYFLFGLIGAGFSVPCLGFLMAGMIQYAVADEALLYRITMMLFFSIGLALPYFVLSLLIQWLSRIQMAPECFIWGKKFFGVSLIGLIFFYLASLIYPLWIRGSVILILIAGGLYLGFMEKSKEYSKEFIQAKKLLGVILISIGLLLPFYGPKKGLLWEDYTPEKLTFAREAGMPVILEFYADWCMPCYELERSTYTDSAVMEALRGYQRLQADVSRMDLPENEKLLEKFHVFGIPTILFFDARGREIEIARVTGYISPEELLQILHSPRFQMDFQGEESTFNEDLLEQDISIE
ncbi:MAG: thioredoxin fold domain-containing protein [Candidatus Omnitrophica bacterium]|nr:thioredoxin fold domain-containing protein [Candidatus Omnitrophota bacterium]